MTQCYDRGVLKGTREGIVQKLQPVSIHGQMSVDVYFTDPSEPDAQVNVARVGSRDPSLHRGKRTPACVGDPIQRLPFDMPHHPRDPRAIGPI